MKNPFKKLLQNICLSAEHGAKGASFRHPSRRKGDSQGRIAKVLAGEEVPVIPREGGTYKPRLVTVTAKDLAEIWYGRQRERCHWMGIKLNPMWIFKSGHPLSISCDRLEDDYTKDTIVLCCRFANLGRQNWPDDEFKEVIKYLQAEWGWEEYLNNPPLMSKEKWLNQQKII